MIVLGVMSGSSLDGLDLALCKIWEIEDSIDYELLACESVPFPNQIHAILANLTSADYSEALAFQLPFTKTCAAIIDDFLTDKTDVDYISWHGHTIAHYPELGYTFPLGNGGQLAMLTGQSVVADFRMQDIATGGKGTPLVPIAEHHLFSDYDAYLNLGGIANVSTKTENKFLAFDVCPCNQLLNFLARKKGLEYDKNGILARKGKLNDSLLEQLNDWDYYPKEPPKSLDNNDIRERYFPMLEMSIVTVEDAINTCVEFIAEQIKRSILDKNLQKILVTGGGTHNLYLLEKIKQKLASITNEVVVPESEIVDFKEAILMSLMGYLRIKERPNVFCSVTGAERDTIAGAIYLP